MSDTIDPIVQVDSAPVPVAPNAPPMTEDASSISGIGGAGGGGGGQDLADLPPPPSLRNRLTKKKELNTITFQKDGAEVPAISTSKMNGVLVMMSKLVDNLMSIPVMWRFWLWFMQMGTIMWCLSMLSPDTTDLTLDASYFRVLTEFVYSTVRWVVLWFVMSAYIAISALQVVLTITLVYEVQTFVKNLQSCYQYILHLVHRK